MFNAAIIKLVIPEPILPETKQMIDAERQMIAANILITLIKYFSSFKIPILSNQLIHFVLSKNWL